MYIRTVRSRGHEYVQLAHNHRDPESGSTRAQVLYSFGRRDRLDVEALRRLVQSISRFLEPEEAERLQMEIGTEWPIEFLGARGLGGAALLDGLWHRLGIADALANVLKPRDFAIPVERLLFAMVANRALAPSSKLHIEHWLANEVHIDGVPKVDVHELYRAMDVLLEAAEPVQREVFNSVADLFNLDVDVLFLDTTSTYFELEDEDPDVEGDDKETVAGLRKRGHSKDRRSDLPQAVIGFAVTRGGIPVRCWVWPGNTSDRSIVDEVKRDLNAWRLGRVVLVEDAGFNSPENRRTLQGAGGHFIIGEQLRGGKKGAPVEALRRGGRYQTLESGLKAKDVIIGDGEARRRYVVVYNSEQAERDAEKRADIVAETERRLAELDREKDAEAHHKAECELRAHPVYGRFIRQTKTGKLRLDKAKLKTEAQLDGKYLLSTSDLTLSTEDVVMGYKQLSVIERVYRDLKHVIDIRPVRHRLPDRIRAHVLLCWLAMLLIRVAENESGRTWFQMKKTLATVQVGIHRTRSGEVWQTTPASAETKTLFETLKVDLPERFLRFPKPKTKEPGEENMGQSPI